MDEQELSEQIRRHATRHAAPDGLRAGIRAQIALADAGRADAPAPTSARAPGPRARWFAWRTAAASFALGVACALVVPPVLQRVAPGGLAEPLEAELVADHVRALQVGPLAEVASSDRHTVKPWFQGRLDYAPPVFDLAADGFPLQGGRVEHVGGGAVAALAYVRNRHVIEVFVWPSEAPAAATHRVRRGFNVLHWADGAMQYWVVSDMERAELERFGEIWRARVAAQ
ncbi:MAG TPA: anti-sigma factor [Burkholderiaceae bacterium]